MFVENGGEQNAGLMELKFVSHIMISPHCGRKGKL
jgi:hypothetical protein